VLDHEGLEVGGQETHLASEADVRQVSLAYGGVDPAGPNREERGADASAPARLVPAAGG
jgi:hypothetical protein